MKQISRKICGTFLALSMLLTLLPVAAYTAPFSSFTVIANGNFGTASKDYADSPSAEFSLLFSDVTGEITGLSASLGAGVHSAFE